MLWIYSVLDLQSTVCSTHIHVHSRHNPLCFRPNAISRLELLIRFEENLALIGGKLDKNVKINGN